MGIKSCKEGFIIVVFTSFLKFKHVCEHEILEFNTNSEPLTRSKWLFFSIGFRRSSCFVRKHLIIKTFTIKQFFFWVLVLFSLKIFNSYVDWHSIFYRQLFVVVTQKKTVACGCCWGSRLLKKIADSWLLLFSSDVRDVGLRSEYSDELVLVVVDVALHDLHART